MRAICPVYYILLVLITLTILMKSKNYEAHHYVIFSLFLFLVFISSTYCPQHPECMFFPQGETPSFAPTQNRYRLYVLQSLRFYVSYPWAERHENVLGGGVIAPHIL